MSRIRIYGDTSGYIDVKAPDVAGNTEVVIPEGGFAVLNSPTFTGIPAAPTANVGTNTTQIATTAFVNSQAPLFTNRNLIYNGAMQVAQRGTSTASITAGGYYTADRWRHAVTTMGTWTDTIENDAPTGSGFRKSFKMLCTTADAAPAAGDVVFFEQQLEGQDLQRIRKGTSSAQQITISFWVKSNVTGTYVLNPTDNDNTRQVGAQYTIAAANTWEKKTITFPADTTGAFDNDNAASLRIIWQLGAGTDRTSGTLRTTWTSTVAADVAVGQTNLAAATNNYWQITGVQLEVGDTATEFEFKTFGQELIECQRYYEKSYSHDVVPGTNQSSFPTIVNQVPFYYSFGQSDGWGMSRVLYTVQKRGTPAVTVYGSNGTINSAEFIFGSGPTLVTLSSPSVVGNDKGFMIQTSGGTAGAALKVVFHYTASAEL